MFRIGMILLKNLKQYSAIRVRQQIPNRKLTRHSSRKKAHYKLHNKLVTKSLSQQVRTISVICKSTRPENYIPAVLPPLNPISPPSTAATFLATRLWWCCNPLGIPSSMAEILLFNSVFHDGVAPVSVSIEAFEVAP